MNRPCHASCRSHEARQLRPLRGNGFDAWRKTTVSEFVSERSGNLRKIVASNGEFTLNLQWVLLFYGHLIRVCRPCPSVVDAICRSASLRNGQPVRRQPGSFKINAQFFGGCRLNAPIIQTQIAATHMTRGPPRHWLIGPQPDQPRLHPLAANPQIAIARKNHPRIRGVRGIHADKIADVQIAEVGKPS